MSDAVWNALGASHHFLDTAKLVAGFLLHDLVQCKAALGVIEKAEVLLGLLDLHHVHKACREEHVRAYFAIDFDQSLHYDHLYLSVRQGILQPLTKHHNQRHALPKFMRTCSWLR